MKEFNLHRIDKAIKEGSETFKTLIQDKIIEDKTFLSCLFTHTDGSGSQISVLNYLILKHNAENNPLQESINELLIQGADINFCQAMHFALQHDKPDLFTFFIKHIKAKKLNVDLGQRDIEGITLLSRLITANNKENLAALIEMGKSNIKQVINQPSVVTFKGLSQKNATEVIECSPLQQAVMSNSVPAIEILVQNGAAIDDNCPGPRQYNLISLAAHCGKVDVLKKLLSYQKSNPLSLNGLAKNLKKDNPIELLCKHFKDSKNKIDKEKFVGVIAMLLAHGAELPEQPFPLSNMLIDNRRALLEEVKTYTKDKPELVKKFVDTCHEKHSSLHAIIYTRHLGKDNTAYLVLESMVNNEALLNLSIEIAKDKVEHHKDTFVANHLNNGDDIENKEKPAADNEGPAEMEIVPIQPLFFSQEEIKFAEFTKLYNDNFKGLFKNPWSKMQYKLAGEINSWNEVLLYASDNSDSRTAKIVREKMGESIPSSSSPTKP